MLNQFLKDFGKVIELKEGSRGKIEYVKAEIDFDSNVNFKKWAKTLKKGNDNIRVVKAFLEYQAKKSRDKDVKELLKEWAEHLKWEGTKKERKLFVEEGEKQAIDNEDYYEHIRKLYEWGLKSKQNAKYAIRAIAGSLLGATTGLRPYEVYRLSKDKLLKALDDGFFILDSTEAKTHVKRVIPIHPKIKDWLKVALELSPKTPFPESKLRKWFKEAGSNIRMANLRPFFIKVAPLQTGMDEVIRICITGHDEHVFTKEAAILQQQDVSEIYRRYTPKAIVQHYIETFAKRFNPIPEGISLEKLLENVKA